MKRLFLFGVLLLFFANNTFSQVLKVDAGVSFSAMESNASNILTDPYRDFNINLGLNYITHKYFHLSSQIGYLTRGGSNDMSIDNSGTNNIKLVSRISCIHINTTIRVKYSFKKLTPYIGIGPKIDFPIESKYSPNIEFSDTDVYNLSLMQIKNYLPGIKYEAGIEYNHESFSYGLNVFILRDFESINKLKNYPLKNQISAINFSVGYAF